MFQYHLIFVSLAMYLTYVVMIGTSHAEIHIAQLDVGNNPEGSVYYGNSIFVSNLGASRNPLPDGDGYVSSYDQKSKIFTQRFLPIPGDTVLNFPMGMAVVSDVIYIVDLKRVIGFNIKTKKRVFETSAPDDETSYLNDIVYLGNNLLLVSATNSKKLYTVNLTTKIQSEVWKPFLDSESHQFVNGLFLDIRENNLYLIENQNNGLKANNGQISSYNLSSVKPTLNWTRKLGRFLDGITILPGEQLLISDWNSMTEGSLLHTLDTLNGELVNTEYTTFKGLADISYDPYNSRAIYPAMLDSIVYIDESMYPAIQTLDCSPLNHNRGRLIKLAIDRVGLPREIHFEQDICPINFSSANEQLSWARASLDLCFPNKPQILEAITEKKYKKQAISLTVVSRKESEPCRNKNPRLCDPSDTSYENYICK